MQRHYENYPQYYNGGGWGETGEEIKIHEKSKTNELLQAPLKEKALPSQGK
jgi:hypothetical protein